MSLPDCYERNSFITCFTGANKVSGKITPVEKKLGDDPVQYAHSLCYLINRNVTVVTIHFTLTIIVFMHSLIDQGLVTSER